MSELTETNRYLYQIQPATVAGLSFTAALEGAPLDATLQASLAAAVRELEAKNVLAVRCRESSDRRRTCRL